MSSTTRSGQPAVAITPNSLRDALRSEAMRIEADPQTNSVFSLAQTLFMDLADGFRELDGFREAIGSIHAGLAEQRAEKFRAQHYPDTGGDRWDNVRAWLDAAAAKGFDAYKTAIETTRGGIVFTAHPTFSLSQATRKAFAVRVADPTAANIKGLTAAIHREDPKWPDQISLTGEHGEVQDVIAHAQDALTTYVDLIAEHARTNFPDTWRTLAPAPPTIATWVGYDLDGRTDIHWSNSIAFRLKEKARQLEVYAERVAALIDHNPGHDWLDQLQAQLEQAVHKTRIKDSTTPDALASQLVSLRALMTTCQLGTARIHLRVNAAQIRAVINRDLGLETEDQELGRLALAELSRKASEETRHSVSFGDLFLEQSTARRQFMMCAQILKHIDVGSPIRFLIAESENPATVMGALYLARQYGVDGALDISPLFETPEALETGGRFMGRLLEEREFVDYVRTRGYMSVQLGFSDSGRFIGQIAGNMAIERIHNLIGRALQAKAPGVGLLIFNTHGESMGRGAWPGTLEQRFNHLLTPWTRTGFVKRGIDCIHEVSFQGGDGFLHFATGDLARATFAGFCSHLVTIPEGSGDDLYYVHTDFVWDFYRSLRSWHEELLANPDYTRLLGDFAPAFVPRAGSRQTRRSGTFMGPRSVRAISHNAMLQQLGIPMNTSGGIGSSIGREIERFVELANQSERMNSLVMLAMKARMLTTTPAVRGYAAVYDPGVWLGLARRANPDCLSHYGRVATALESYETPMGILRIVNWLSLDLARFDRAIAQLDDAPSTDARHEMRSDMHSLHAIRQAVMMYAIYLAGQMPGLSPRHDTSIEDIMELVTSMRLTEAVDRLRTIFPSALTGTDKLGQLEETGSVPLDGGERGYDELHRKIIDPLEAASDILRRISLALAHEYAAHG